MKTAACSQESLQSHYIKCELFDQKPLLQAHLLGRASALKKQKKAALWIHQHHFEQRCHTDYFTHSPKFTVMRQFSHLTKGPEEAHNGCHWPVFACLQPWVERGCASYCAGQQSADAPLATALKLKSKHKANGNIFCYKTHLRVKTWSTSGTRQYHEQSTFFLEKKPTPI